MKKGIIVGCVITVALCAVVLPKVLTKKPFAEAVTDPIVEVTIPKTDDILISSGLVGSVEPEEVVYVYPKASGDVTDVRVKSGEYVEVGQVICVIDTKQLENAKSTLDTAELALNQAKDELSRQAVLYSGDGISAQAYQQYQNSVKSAQISYDNAKTNYDNQVSYSQITAPISGIIESCNVEVFDVVSQGNLVCIISGSGSKIVSFSATERIRRNLNEGDGILLEKEGQEYKGTIYEVSSMADSDTGLFKIKARLDEGNDDSNLPTGSMVKLHVISEQANQVMTVPMDSVYYDGGLAYVYTYDDGIIHKVQIEVGIHDLEKIEVVSGLTGAEQVLTTWNKELFEGSRARLAENFKDSKQ